eukprot:TRINITY_DN9760_c0_g1_i1.p1 TRINITY_DN9760_c0_g1~~TRINITY_DN9760_c0_g1_i1.p1  ORF type:complete len:128 (-),score=10.25 TRINITY_DN9760_c0_g1_i1:61-399(-)
MASHLGGYVTGLIFGVSLCQNVLTSRWKNVIRILAIPLGILFLLFCVLWSATQWPPRSLFDDSQFCWAASVVDASIFGDTSTHCVICSDDACIAKFENSHYVPGPTCHGQTT